MQVRFPLLLVSLLFVPSALLAQSTAFTYQGRLTAAGSSANGLYEMSFTLYDAVTNGHVIGTPVTVAPVAVSNGLFTVALGFGITAFTGPDRWLEIAVTVFGSDQPVITLVPRQSITPVPYALHAANAAGLMTFSSAPLDIKINSERVLRLDPGSGGTPNVIAGASVNGVAPGVLGATIGGGGTSAPGFEATNRVEANYGTISGGLDNTIRTGSRDSTIGGGDGNLIGTDSGWSTIGGGEANSIERNARYSVIAGGGLNSAGGFGSVISGGSLNGVKTNAEHASIGGGLRNWIAANAMFSTIGGGNGNTNSREYGTIGGGDLNITAGFYATVGGGRRNTSSGGFATIAGGYENAATSETSTVGGGFANSAGHEASTIAGGANNVTGGDYSAIGGGSGNTSSGDMATIGGGLGNVGSGQIATVAGGQNNTASGLWSTVTAGAANSASGDFATVGGGGHNLASGYGATVAGGGGLYFDGESAGNQAGARWSTVGGGALNAALGTNSTVGGGSYNIARGEHATIPGGFANHAEGAYSFAAGENASADHAGAFVWADSSFVALHSTTTNQFTARAAGGVRLFTDANATTGAELAPGSGTWSSLSDRNAKENFAAADPREILDKVAALPMTSWNYKAQDAKVRHLGPMAQDFHAAFGLGENDRTITTVDADGVALAAIQGLNAKLEEELKAKDARIARLERRLAEIEKRLGQSN
jgi:hypothetical protein